MGLLAMVLHSCEKSELGKGVEVNEARSKGDEAEVVGWMVEVQSAHGEGA
jgi:hypothetical protein